jgi:hypothetical protein
MTPAIAAAMIKIAQAVPQLGKADRNQFAKYNYVSIDKYYDTIGRLAAANGIMWQAFEVENSVLRDVGKDGALRITYSFDLYHENGDIIKSFAAFTILHPIQGAQTAGSALSYAEKLFMRSAFKVVTGESDADASDPDDLKIRPKADLVVPAGDKNVKTVTDAFPDAQVTDVRPAGGTSNAYASDPSPHVAVIDHLEPDGLTILKKDASDWAAIKQVLEMGLVACKSPEHVKDLWTKNIGVIDRMLEKDKDTHAIVRAAFNARRGELKKG